jgi:hypothetical protein
MDATSGDAPDSASRLDTLEASVADLAATTERLVLLLLDIGDLIEETIAAG